MQSTSECNFTQHQRWVEHTRDVVRTPVKEFLLDFAGIPHKVLDVPADACLPMPAHYRIPKSGQAREVLRHVSVALKNRRSIYLHGEPGTGKDAVFHAWSALTHTPALMFQVQPGVDIQSWFWQRGFDQHGTRDEEGDLLVALRDGYMSPEGQRYPYMILLSDFDRADRNQAEALRLIMDSISGRVKGPRGVTYQVLEGTMIVATANSAGAGDPRGRCISSNPLDASILDRFERKFQSAPLSWDDERTVLASKFPNLVFRHPDFLSYMGRITESIRQTISQNLVSADFSHRALCGWLSHAEDLMDYSDSSTKDLIMEGAAAYLDGLPDPDTRTSVIRAIDPHIAAF